MKKNMGALDRVLRVVIALTLSLLYYYEIITGPWAIAGIFVSVIFILTGFIGSCPIYMALGLSTSGSKQTEE